MQHMNVRRARESRAVKRRPALPEFETRGSLNQRLESWELPAKFGLDVAIALPKRYYRAVV